MAQLLLWAQARQAAGRSRAEFGGSTVAAVLESAVAEFGPGFAEVLATCAVWVNGEPAQPTDEVCDDDEVAILPPVSGG